MYFFILYSVHFLPFYCTFTSLVLIFKAVHISVLRKEEHACSFNTIPYDSAKYSDFIHIYFSKLGILPQTRCLRCATDGSA